MPKLHHATKVRGVLAEARDLLGGNGILLDFHAIRHMADIEAVGRDITGVGAFA